MKNKGIRVALALILALMMVLGSVGTASAGKPVREIEITIYLRTMPAPTYYKVSANATFSGYGAWAYYYQWWWSADNSTWNDFGQSTIKWLNGAHKRQTSGNLNLDGIYKAPPNTNRYYKVQVWLLKKNGMAAARGSVAVDTSQIFVPHDPL